MSNEARLMEIEASLKTFPIWVKVQPENVKIQFQYLIDEVKRLNLELKNEDLAGNIQVKDCLFEIEKLLHENIDLRNQLGK